MPARLGQPLLRKGNPAITLSDGDGGLAQVQVVYESTNGFSNGRAVLHGFEVSHLCALHIQEKLADLGQFLTG